MNDIFVSYASEDRTRVQPLVAALQASGWTVFWDRTIPTGRTWREVIGKALRDARAVVVVWTERSVESEWVLEEAESGKRRRCLVPVLLDAVDPPLGFGSIQAANLVGWTADRLSPSYQSLAADIEALIGSTAADPARATSTSAAATPSATTPRAPRASRPSKPTANPGRRWLWPSATLVAGALGIVWIAPWQESPSAPIAKPVAAEPMKQEPTKEVPANKPRTIASIIASMPMAQPPQTQTNPTPAEVVAATNAISNAIRSIPSGPSCDDLVFDPARGTLNGLSPSVSQEVVKQVLPCSTGSTPDGSDFNYGGGVFFLNHDFFFYTGRNFIEVRSRFTGRETEQLLGRNKQSVVSLLGRPQSEYASGQVLLYQKPYGCLRVEFGGDAGTLRVNQLGAHLMECSRVQAAHS